MIQFRHHAILSLLPICLVAGCAASKGGYPSLALRPIERVEMSATPASPTVAPAPIAPAPVMAPANVAGIVASAHGADHEFQAKLAEMRPAIEAGRSAASGSESWVVSQQAFSAAEISRGGIGSAMADLDRLHEQAVSAGDVGQQATIEAAILEVQALDDAAQAALAAVQPGGG